jgi:hypothetical protein
MRAQLMFLPGEWHRKAPNSASVQEKSSEQDYLFVPSQRYLAGFYARPGETKQFVAMPIDDGYTVEKQITGKGYIDGIQIRYRAPLFGIVSFRHNTRNTQCRPKQSYGKTAEVESCNLDRFLVPRQTRTESPPTLVVET